MKKTTEKHNIYRALSWLVAIGILLALAIATSLLLDSSRPMERSVVSKSVSSKSRTSQSEENTPAENPDGMSPPFRIIALGDSLTAGYGLPLAESYPALLEQQLQREGFHVDVINAGVSGETTSGTLSRVGFIRAQSPKLVILGIGGNDMLRFIPNAVIEQNLRAILRGLTAPPDAPDVILLQMAASENAGLEAQEAFDALYPRLATEFNVALVPFVIPQVFLDPQMMLEDGIHPNRNGYSHLVSFQIAPAVGEILLSHLP